MTRSTVKRLTEPLDEPEREFRRLKRAALRSHQNESLAIAERNHFDDQAYSSKNTGPKPSTPPKTLHEHSRLTSSGFQNPITVPTNQTERIVDSRDIWFIQNTCTFQGLKTEDPLRHVKHYLSIVDNIQADEATRDTSRLRSSTSPSKEKWQNGLTEYLLLKSRHGINSFHDSSTIYFWLDVPHDLWDDMPPRMNISSISETVQPTFKGRLKRVCNQISFLETPTQEVGLKTPYLIYDYCGGSHEADECKQLGQAEQVCLSGVDISDDPSLLRFYQNDDTSPWGNNKCKGKGEDGPEWTIRGKFEDELANFMLENKSHAKGI
ncbi:hypothetical protein Tco_0522938 [Tanacetum coccineum]